MNILLWILQVLLALHTAMGAVWKFSHTAEQTMPSLSAIPSSVWMMMSVLELLFAVGLIIPGFKKNWGVLIPIAAVGIVIEMLVFCGLHLSSGATDMGPMIYWLVVAAVSGFIAYVRFARMPVR